MDKSICIEVLVDQKPEGVDVWKKPLLTAKKHAQAVVPGKNAKYPPNDEDRCANADRYLRCCCHAQSFVA